MKQFLSLLICLLALDQIVLVQAEKQVEFVGKGSAQIDIIPSSSSVPDSASLEAFLRREESNGLLLGTNDIVPYTDDHWDCKQPSFRLFGKDFIPIFRVGLWRYIENNGLLRILVAVKESRTAMLRQQDDGARLHSSLSSNTSGSNEQQQDWMLNMLQRGKIEGESEIMVKPSNNGKGWMLSMSTSLKMKMNVPKYLPLPPGFAMIGSVVMNQQCQDRAHKSLVELGQAYAEWSEQRKQKA